MEIKQVYELANLGVGEALGKTDVLKEDLTNLVDVGNEIINNKSLDKFVHALVDRIGRVVFVDRVYNTKTPDILRDNWDYGAVLEKIDIEMPEATENETWELQDGASYDPNVFHQPKASAKFFNKYTTFEIDASVTDIQARSAFASPAQLNSFISMLFTKVQNKLKLSVDKLKLSTIASAVASTYHADIGAGNASQKSGVKAVNLLKLYNDSTGKTLNKYQAMKDLDFLKFASRKIRAYSDYRTQRSELFNIGGKDRFTDKNLQHIVLLSDFKRSADVYLQSDTFHNEFTKLPDAQVVNFWQGSGKGYSLDDIAKIDVKDAEGNDVTIDCLIGCIFDRDRLAVCCQDYHVNTYYNPKAEFSTYFYKFKAGYFNDLNENMVIFFLA